MKGLLSTRATAVVVAAVLVLGGVAAATTVLVGSRHPGAASGVAGSATHPATPGATVAPATPTPPPTPTWAQRARAVYVHYYLFWSAQHWQSTLGRTYPLAANPPPLPGAMDATGCNPRVAYAGSRVVDLPSEGPYDQADPATFDRHLATAASAGITGFLVSWMGTGVPTQSPSSYGYNSRLDLLVQRADLFIAKGGRFSLGLAFASFGDYARPADQVIADLDYFVDRYGDNQAFRNPYSDKPVVMWLDSRKYPLDTVQKVAAAERSKMYLVGDETAVSWARDAPYLDATSYYWSSENPWTNGNAQSSVDALGDAVRAAHKRWFAPFIAGYNKQLEGGSCVPRNGLRTLDQVWAVNATSHPDGWFGISWNEMVENTYLEPSRQYGTRYLDELQRLIAADPGG